MVHNQWLVDFRPLQWRLVTERAHEMRAGAHEVDLPHHDIVLTK